MLVPLVAFLEQPLAKHDLQGMRTLREGNVPICVDESVMTEQDAVRERRPAEAHGSAHVLAEARRAAILLQHAQTPHQLSVALLAVAVLYQPNEQLGELRVVIGGLGGCGGRLCGPDSFRAAWMWGGVDAV